LALKEQWQFGFDHFFSLSKVFKEMRKMQNGQIKQLQ